MNTLVTAADAAEVESIRREGWDLSKDAHLSAMVQGLLHLGHRFSIMRVRDDWQVGWTCKAEPRAQFMTAQIWGMRLPCLRRAMVDATERVWKQSRQFVSGYQLNGDPPPNPNLPCTETVHRFSSPINHGLALLRS